MHSIRIRTTILFCCLLAFSSLQGQDTLALHYSNYIQPEIIHKHLSVLTSDSLEGRETSMPGMVKAANYVAAQFYAMGIPASNNGSYFQEIPLIRKKNSTVKMNINGKEAKFPDEFFATEASAFFQYSSSEIIFVGYGIQDSVSGWNDYAKADIAGKTVMILDGEPINKKGISLISKTKEPGSWLDNRQAKVKLAKDKNAAAVIFISADLQKIYEKLSNQVNRSRYLLASDTVKRIPVICISQKVANEILKQTSFKIESYEKKIAGKKKPLTLTVSSKISISNESEKTVCRNVLGYIEGTTLKEELILITAHLDHLGKQDDKIYYGADDDGSGSSSILNIAEAFQKAKKEGHGTKRSILIMTFSGEEKGLLGSEYYTDQPVFSLKNTVADLNIDMIGRVDTIKRASENYTYIIGSDKLSTQLHKINEAENKNCCNLELDYRYNDPSDKLKLYYRSDHYNFAKNNIPVIFYFTGIHEDYHKPTDTIDKIDFNKTAKIAKLVFNTAWDLANREDRIVVDVKNDFK